MSTGHNICYLCVDEVSECPLCKSDYGDTRNYFAEELVNSMTFPCKYEEYGCHQTFLGSELKEHQENCECQPYRCPELACQEVVGIHQMGKHLDKHGFKIMTGDVHQASVEILDDHFDRKTEYNPWRITAFGAEFYTVSTRSRDGLWYFWAYGLGLQKDMKKFSYEVVLYSDEKQVMYRGAVQSLRNAPEDIMKNGSCLITTDNMIKSIRKNGRIKCQVYFIHGKNWDQVRSNLVAGKGKSKQALKNLKKHPITKGKNKVLIPTSVTYTCPSTSSSSPMPSLLSTPKTSRSRVLHNNIKASAMDLLKKEQSSISAVLGSGSGSSRNKLTKSKRTASNVSTTNRNTISEDENTFVQKVRDTLRCPGCNEVITPPVYQCLIGHNVCHKCKTTRQDCALCRAPIGECRNFFAEELLYKTFQRCPYSKHGCKVCLPSAHMRSHEAICEFAPFECPFNVCRAMLCAEELFDHLQTHQIAVISKELKTEIVVPRNAPTMPICTIPNIITIDKIPFYPIVVRDTDGSWLFYIISHNHSKYRYELLIKKQSKTIAFQGPVQSIRTNFTQVKQKGTALIATERTVKCFKSHDKLSYHIKISKVDAVPSDTTSSFCLPISWILVSRKGELVSKTELFANKKTSVSPDEDSDGDDTTVSLPRNDPAIYISEAEDFETESGATSEMETSTRASTIRDEESEYESDNLNNNRTDGNETQKEETNASEAGSLTSESSPTKEKPVDESNYEDLPELSAGSSGLSRSAASVHNLSLAKEESASAPSVPISEHNSDLITDANKDKTKRSRSVTKNRVRLSQDVICCINDGTDPLFSRCKGPSKSQANLHSSPSRLTAMAMKASKHMLSSATWAEDEDKTPPAPASSVVNEFDQLKQALEKLSKEGKQNAVDDDMPVMEEVGDLLTVKSLNGMSEAISAVNDAVISGSFDVVKSVISLFTSDKKEIDKTAENSSENLGSDERQ
ncbi:E3 ubiquitin-protein ligase sina [Orchesella cincta]|uniref:E3 ubiquitin-protein ligase n=1 Tax=Orchesella cincta TaxID=48709 RepID=A0A1D2NL63_ORCCI|nr:E3 ubiquitin-protein ligase sina [Orchesella cincta]